jgi:hypothetical protein
VLIEIHTIWRTAKACCEVVVQGHGPIRLLVWVGSALVYQQMVTTFTEAMTAATELRLVYA